MIPHVKSHKLIWLAAWLDLPIQEYLFMSFIQPIFIFVYSVPAIFLSLLIIFLVECTLTRGSSLLNSRVAFYFLSFLPLLRILLSKSSNYDHFDLESTLLLLMSLYQSIMNLSISWLTSNFGKEYDRIHLLKNESHFLGKKAKDLSS